MSADNWTTCPRCQAAAEKAKSDLQQQAAKAYGVLPIEEFDALRARADAPVAIDRTFREDYEFYGADEGEVVACYSGHCKTCGLNVEFKHSVPFWEDAR